MNNWVQIITGCGFKSAPSGCTIKLILIVFDSISICGTGPSTGSGTGTMTYKSTLLSTKYNGCIHVHIEMWEWKLLYWKHKKS